MPDHNWLMVHLAWVSGEITDEDYIVYAQMMGQTKEAAEQLDRFNHTHAALRAAFAVGV